jgi:hypothetical protein
MGHGCGMRNPARVIGAMESCGHDRRPTGAVSRTSKQLIPADTATRAVPQTSTPTEGTTLVDTPPTPDGTARHLCPTRSDVLQEIDARLRTARAMAQTRGETLKPPLLLLGTSERVGSNWLSDTLRPLLGQHNEPFRQQLDPHHRLSALNPHLGHITGTVPDRQEPGNAFERHWLVTFAVGKYAAQRQVVKETNLFFALTSLLALLPDAPITVLTRSPLGVASSFVRGELFRRWDYRARYHQMITTTSRHVFSGYRALVPDDNPPELVALARLQVLNAILLAEAL